jgi:hypothetical protein
VSKLLDQVAVKVARAERAFVRLRKIIAAAGEDLQTQQLWLDQNRASPLKGQRPLGNKRAILAFARFAVGLPLLLPVGSVKGRTIISALGVMILLLIAAGAVRTTTPASQCEVPLSLAPKVAPEALPATALTEPLKSTPRSPSVAGFSLIQEVFVPEPQPLSAYSTLSMMLIASIMPPPPIKAEATTALVVSEPPAAKPPIKAQTKRKLASQKPPEISWWQHLPWIRVR